MKTKRLAIMGLFVALMCVSAWIRIPLPIPITLQTAVVALAAMLLLPWEALLVMVVYVALGLIGIPVFAGGGGLTYVASPTFGYLMGFIVAAFFGSAYLNKKPLDSSLPTAQGLFKGVETGKGETPTNALGFAPNLITGLIVVIIVFGFGTCYTWGYARFVADAPFAFSALFSTTMGFLWLKDTVLVALMAVIAPKIRGHVEG
jgi:biotin transporter BioY